METDLALWLVARASGIAAYAALCVSMLTGLAFWTDAFDGVWTRKALRSLHEFTAVIWIPLGIAHVDTLLLDATARISAWDVVVPFATGYGQLAIGLGTLSLDLTAVVVVTSWARNTMSVGTWRALHRLSYAGFALAFAHSILSGTDLAASLVGFAAAVSAASIGLLALSRMFRSRAFD